MARVKRAVNAHKKRRAILEQASGYRGQRSRLYRKAKEQVTHSLVYNYNHRKKRKGDFRQLWIQRINAAARANGITYNRFHNAAMCSPSRAALLTGRNHHRVGFGQIAELANNWDGYTGHWPATTASMAKVLGTTYMRALLPIPVIVAIAPIIWLVFRKTWRDLDIESQIHRSIMLERGEYDFRPAVMLVMVWAVGDFSSILAVAPATLLQAKYSRDFEREADAFAADLLVAHGIKPSVLADLLERIDADQRRKASSESPDASDPSDAPEAAQGSSLLDYASSHPATSERLEYLRRR